MNNDQTEARDPKGQPNCQCASCVTRSLYQVLYLGDISETPSGVSFKHLGIVHSVTHQCGDSTGWVHQQNSYICPFSNALCQGFSERPKQVGQVEVVLEADVDGSWVQTDELVVDAVIAPGEHVAVEILPSR